MQCYAEDNESICTISDNNLQNKYLLDDHKKKYQIFKECDDCGKQMPDYMELTGKTLFHATDQVGEAVHHSVKQFIEFHPNYNHTDKNTEEYGEDILTGIKHFNSNNICSI